jgi:hypothetical protein
MEPHGGTVYVYGIVAGGQGEPPTLEGVEHAPVRVIAHAGIGALVSDVAGGALSAAREVRAHWQVLQAASEHGTVIPVRFGTVMEDDPAVRERLLEPNADTLARQLEAFAGRVQLSVKGSYDEDRLMQEVVTASPAVQALRERLRGVPPAAAYYDRIRLGEMVAGEVARRREQDAQLALSRLQPLALAVHEEPAGRPDAAFDLAFLVERAGIEAFGRAVAQVGEDLGDRVRIRFVGPLPPYSFTESSLAPEEEAWA